MDDQLTPPPQSEPQLSKKQLRRQARLERKASEEKSRTTQKTTKRIFLWGSILVVIALVVWGFVALINTKTPGVTGDGTVTITADDHVKGNPSSTVTLVEYGDFQCPACGAYYPMVKQVIETFASSSQFVFRHFPLTSVHPNAMAAAQASEAAANQGKFWQMYDLLFTNQTKWASLVNPTDTFVGYAKDLGLDTQQFQKELTSAAVKSRVQRDMTSGNQLGVNSTPTFYLNGKQIQPRSVDEFKTAFINAGAVSE